MSGFDIVMVIAVILFARLGVRLVTRYIKIRKEDHADTQNKDANTGSEP
jgi:hypothetical protein